MLFTSTAYSFVLNTLCTIYQATYIGGHSLTNFEFTFYLISSGDSIEFVPMPTKGGGGGGGGGVAAF